MNISLFEGVPVDDVAAALARLERRRFSAGSTVLFEGDYPGELYLVESDTAHVVTTIVLPARAAAGDAKPASPRMASANTALVANTEAWVLG